jgi:HEAT repeat protein
MTEAQLRLLYESDAILDLRSFTQREAEILTESRRRIRSLRLEADPTEGRFVTEGVFSKSANIRRNTLRALTGTDTIDRTNTLITEALLSSLFQDFPETSHLVLNALIGRPAVLPLDFKIEGKVVALALTDADSLVRNSAAFFLSIMADDKTRIIDQFIYKLQWATAWEDQKQAAEALLSLQSTEPRVFDALLDALLDSPDRPLREYVQYVLQQLYPNSRVTRAKLIEALTSDDPVQRLRAAEALKGFFVGGVGDVDRALAAALKDQDIRVRTQAAASLGAFRMTKEPAVAQALAEALTDPHLGVRIPALISLAGLAPRNPQAALAVAKRLESDDGAERTFAKEALLQMQKSDPQQEPSLALVKLLQYGTGWSSIFHSRPHAEAVRQEAASLLKILRPNHPKVLDELKKLGTRESAAILKRIEGKP